MMKVSLGKVRKIFKLRLRAGKSGSEIKFKLSGTAFFDMRDNFNVRLLE